MVISQISIQPPSSAVSYQLHHFPSCLLQTYKHPTSQPVGGFCHLDKTDVVVKELLMLLLLFLWWMILRETP